MSNSKQDKRSRFFTEAALNLRYGGFTVDESETGILLIEQGGQHLCQVTETGGVRYWKEDVASEDRQEALSKVMDIAEVTAEYMGQMETAPQLAANSLKGDYRLLVDFNGIVLAGHPTKYGVQFITWERTHDRAALDQGRYYGPYVGIDSYTAAKQGFATRSGLIPRSALFTPEQLTEVYRSIHETLDNNYPITEERQKCLQSVAEQIEHSIPDLEERASLSNQKELDASEQSGMQFC